MRWKCMDPDKHETWIAFAHLYSGERETNRGNSTAIGPLTSVRQCVPGQP